MPPEGEPEVWDLSDLPEDEAAAELIRAAAVQEVVEHAKRIEFEIQTAKPIVSYRSRPIVLSALAIPMLAVSLYVTMAKPDWAYGPDPARAPLALREGHARVAMYLIAQRLYAYRDVHAGELPETLLAIGEEWPGITYTVKNGTEFELHAAVDPSRPVSFQSTDDARVLMDANRRFLRERP